MGIDWRVLRSAAIGKVLGALFLAVCVSLGLGPERWVEFLVTDFPSWVTPAAARSVLLAAGALTFVLLLVPKGPQHVITNAAHTFALTSPLVGGRVENGWRVHEFDLIADKGSTLYIGQCPGIECVVFRLEDIVDEGGVKCVRFTLGGEGLGISDGSNSAGREGLIFESDNIICIMGSGWLSPNLGAPTFTGQMAISEKSCLEINGKLRHVRLQVSSSDIQALSVLVAVRPGTFRGLR